MKRNEELLSKLGTALPKPSRRPAKDKSIPAPAVPAAGVSKVSIGLYAADLARLDEIKAFMHGQGFRNLSDSEALRLACRAVEISDRFVEVYQSMLSADQRRKSKVA